MHTFFVFLHILAAIVFVGPVIVIASATPRLIRKGDERLGALRWAHRTTKIYAWGSLLVFATGLVAGLTDDDVDLGAFWLSASMALFFVAWVLMLYVARQQDGAIERIEKGDSPATYAQRIGAMGGIASLLWIGVLALMIWQPGG